MKVEFYRHNVGAEERALVDEVLRGTFLTSGPRTIQFEEEFSKYLGVKYSLGFQSWTSAAYMVLMAWGVGAGDEVIVPAMTFIATANVALLNGAKAVFCDSDPKTGIFDLDHLETLMTPNTKVVIPVHLYGHMADMKRLRSIADRHGIKILEDCAHCIEGIRDGIRPGQLGDAACFSFYATKNITCGEGGAVSTNDENLFEKLKLIRLHGMSKSAAERYTKRYSHWDMEILGFKGNMNDIQAAMLIPQIPRMDEILVRKESICQKYEQEFTKAEISYPIVEKGSVSARHLFTFFAPEGKRDQVLSTLQDRGLGVAVNFRAVPTLSFYREYLHGVNNCPKATWIGEHTITIPMYPRLTDEEVEYVCSSVIDSVNQFR